MAQDVLITPGSGEINFKDNGSSVAIIDTDTSGNLSITNSGGSLSIGNTQNDVYIGDGTNSGSDIIFEQNGAIRALTNKTLTLGQADSSISVSSKLTSNLTFTPANDRGIYFNTTSGQEVYVRSKSGSLGELQIGSDNKIEFIETDANSLRFLFDTNSGTFTPGANGYDLGSTSNRWEVYGTSGDFSSNLTVGGSCISTGDFTIDSGDGIILDADGGAISLKDDGTRFGILEKATNDLVISNPIDDANILFKYKDGGTVKTALTLNGSGDFAAFPSGLIVTGTLSALGNVNLSADLTLNDSGKIKLGIGGDLEIYHDQSNSYITNTGTGILIIGDSNGDVRIRGKSGEESIVANDDGAVELYYDNSKKFETTSAGVSVTGSLTTGGGLTINAGNASLKLNDTSSGSLFWIFSNGNELRMAVDGASFPSAYLNLTTGGNLGLGVTGASERLVVGGNIMLTSGAILTNHSSNNNYGFQIKSADASQSALELRDNGNNWRATFYGATSTYGFLDGPWGSWDIKKNVDGALQIDQGSGLETVLTTTGGTLTGNLTLGGGSTSRFYFGSKRALEGQISSNFLDVGEDFGSTRMRSSTSVYPTSSITLGTSANRWSTIYGGTGNFSGQAEFRNKLHLIGLTLDSGQTPSYIKIKTKIPFASSAADFTVNIKGFQYGSARTVDLKICWHYYNSTFYNATISSAGGWLPTAQLSAEDDNGTDMVCIVLASPGYWPKMYVESAYSKYYGSSTNYFTGWTWTDAAASGTGNKLVTLTYNNKFGNVQVSGTLSGESDLALTGADHTLYSGEGDNELRFGRGSSECMRFYVNDYNAYFDLIQDADSNQDHHVYFRNQAAGTGARGFKFEGGPVGINTIPNAASYLHVNGWSIFESGSSLVSVRLKSSAGEWDIDNNNGTFGLQWAGGDKLTLSNSGNLTVGGTLDVNGSGQQMASFGNTSARCGIEVKSSQWCEVFFTNSSYANSARIGMAYDSSHSSGTVNGDWYVYQPNVSTMDLIVKRAGGVTLCSSGHTTTVGGPLTIANNNTLSLGTTGNNTGTLRLFNNNSTAHYLDYESTGARAYRFHGSSSGSAYATTFSQAGTGGHNVSVQGNLTVNGNTTLGDAGTDTTTVSGSLVCGDTPYPASNSVALGYSTNRFANVYSAEGNFSTNVTIGGNLSVSGNGVVKQIASNAYATADLNNWYTGGTATLGQYYRYDSTHGHFQDSAGNVASNAPNTLTHSPTQVYSYGALLTLDSNSSFRGQFYMAHSASEIYWRSGWGSSGDQNWTRLVGDRNIQSVIHNVGHISTKAGNNLTVGGSVTVQPGSGDGILFLKNSAASQILRLDQNSIRTTTNNNLNLFTNGNSNQLHLSSGGSVGIGTGSPASGKKLHVAGQVQADSSFIINNTAFAGKFQGFGTGPLQAFLGGSPLFHWTTYNSAGSATLSNFAIMVDTDGDVSFGNTTSSSLPRSLYLDTSGNLGIGASPGYKLDVYGSFGSSAGAGLRLKSSATDDNGIIHEQADGTLWFTGQETSNPNDYEFWYYNGSNYSHILHLDNSGKVGIGTTSPDSQLEIAGGGYNSSLKIKGGGSHTGIQFEDSSGTTDGYIYAENGSIGLLDSGASWMIQCKDDDYIRFATNGNAERMRIEDNGNVGIGTTAPYNLLHVNGNGRINSLIVGNSAANNTPAAALHIKSSGTAAVLRIEDSDSSNQVYDFLCDQGSGLSIIDKGTGSSTNTRLQIDTNGNATFSGAVTASSFNGALIDSTIGAYVSTHGAAQDRPVGWYTIAINGGNRAIARFGLRDVRGGDHQSVVFYAAHNYGQNHSNVITVLHASHYSGNPYRYIRIKEHGTYDGAVLQVYIDDATNDLDAYLLGDNFQANGWVLKDWIADATDPGGVNNYSSMTAKGQVDLNQVAQGGIVTTGDFYGGGDTTQYKLATETWVGTQGYVTASHNHAASAINSGSFADARVAQSNVTQHEAAIDHDALTNFVANEHIDWTTDQGATNIHSGNYTDTQYTSSDFDHDALTNYDAAQHRVINDSSTSSQTELWSAYQITTELGTKSDTSHTHSAATTSSNGFMSSTDKSKLDGLSNYSHPSHPGDDFAVDTGALTGAIIVSDIDINVTTDTLGHVTDCNGSVSTRTLNWNDLPNISGLNPLP